jgi:hypothetical protein
MSSSRSLVIALSASGAVACANVGSPPPSIGTSPTGTSAGSPIPLHDALGQLARAQALCSADHGALWGVSLCGPIMLVDRGTRFIVASQADARGLLRAQGGVFVGSLPSEETIANTATTWAGVRWVQLVWPLPEDPAVRDVTMMHEMFHRIADEVGIVAQGNVDNPQLATADGRYYLQLEWRALAAALRATTDEGCRRAVANALAFRRARRTAYPGAAAGEDALEMHEGLAQYTGVVVGQPAARVAAALRDLSSHVADASFVRSFAYATGAAYGLLLDRYAPAWRAAIKHTRSLSDTLATAVDGAAADAELAAVSYDGPALRLAEAARAERIAAVQAQYQRALVDGPVVTLGLHNKKIEFDPRGVQPLGSAGSVYLSLRVVDDWGVLQVTSGALLTPDWSAVVVPAPGLPASPGAPVVGEGWTLELSPGWGLEPGARAGDLRVVRR